MKKTNTKIVNDTKEISVKPVINLVPTELNLKEELANLINSSFTDSFLALEKYKYILDVSVKDEDDVDTMQEGRMVRLAVAKLRTNADKIRKFLKEDSLKYSNGIQSAYNKLLESCTQLEDHSRGLEEYKQIQEDKRKEERKEYRLKLVDPYIEFFPISIDLKEMSDDEFSIFLNGLKLQLNEKIEKEKLQAELKIKEEEDRNRMLEELKKAKEDAAKLQSELNAVKAVNLQTVIPAKPVSEEASDSEKFAVFRNKLLEVKAFLPTNLKEKANIEKVDSVRELLNKVYVLVK